MVVFDAVDVVLHVHGERHSIQTLLTHHAAETAGMVGLAESLEDLDAHERDRERREGGREATEKSRKQGGSFRHGNTNCTESILCIHIGHWS